MEAWLGEYDLQNADADLATGNDRLVSAHQLLSALLVADHVFVEPFEYQFDTTNPEDDKEVAVRYFGTDFFLDEDGNWKNGVDMSDYDQYDDDCHKYGQFIARFLFRENRLLLDLEIRTTYAHYCAPEGFHSSCLPGDIGRLMQSKHVSVRAVGFSRRTLL